MHRKGLVIGILILMLGVNIGSTFAGDVDVKTMSSVGFDGNTLYVGGGGPNNYTTIQSAIDNASDGDTVFVYDDSSPYFESIAVGKSIMIIGEDKNTTIINGSIDVNAIHVNITCFTITLQNGNGILISELDTIYNNNIYGDGETTSNGISIEGNDNLIQNNLIINWDMGIWMSNTDSNIVKNNTFDMNGWGMYCELMDNSIIYGNIFLNNYYEAIFFRGNYCNISYNTFLDNDGGIGLFEGDYNITYKNIISCTKHVGIRINSITHHNLILENIISNNSYGISLNRGLFTSSFSESSYTTIRRNDIHNNIERGIGVANNNNIIEMNNIENNGRNADFVHCVKNTWDGNYWGESFNNPYPIFGRFSIFLRNICFIPWINIDWHPAQEPYDIGV